MSTYRTPQTGKLFVVQQHHASHLHFDLRLEHRGVLLSWAVPKGPSFDPADKRFAAHVEDHPVDYADFEGQIPDGNYGAGHVIVWDRGTWSHIGDVEAGLEKGKLLFDLHGYKLKGRWTLVRMKGRDNKASEWLFIKESDAYAIQNPPPPDDTSILSGLTVQELAQPAKWRKSRERALTRHQLSTAPSTPPKPMLASPGEAFDRKGWLFEFKYDGYRLIAQKRAGRVQLISRNGHDLTHHLPEIVAVLSHIPVDDFVIDGEVVVADESAKPSFSLLQHRFSADSAAELARLTVLQPVTFWAFDLLSCFALDCTSLPLGRRKELLRRLVPRFGAVRYSEHVTTHGKATFQQAVAIGIEGIVAKDASAPYKAGRSQSWIKVRHQRTDDFVIVGFKPARSNLDDIGSLALAEYHDNVLTYVGSVASGLSGSLRATLAAKLTGKGQPLTDNPRTNWVAPNLVCEVSFKEYTRAGHLRQPVFVRLREDKQPKECTGRFLPSAGSLAASPAPHVVVTNPDKVFFPEASLLKKDLVAYYEEIAPWMLPYLAQRPIVLTRYPDGVNGKSFYQRDAPDFVPDWVDRITLFSDSAEREVHYFLVHSAAALKYLANMAAIPIHTWHARVTNLHNPDWCVLDLDPKSAPFKDVIVLARAIHELCDELQLPSFPKTSGASGLHVLIPLNQQLDHEQSRLVGELLARVIVARYPDIATVARTLSARQGKVYVDYLQNGHGRLLVAPFSVRAEPFASVSMPLNWHEVTNKLDNTNYTIKNAARRMKRLKADPMHNLLNEEADLIRALAQLNQIYSESV